MYGSSLGNPFLDWGPPFPPGAVYVLLLTVKVEGDPSELTEDPPAPMEIETDWPDITEMFLTVLVPPPLPGPPGV